MNRTWKIFFYIKLTIKLIILIYHNSDSSFDLGVDLSFNHFTNFSFIQDVQLPNFTYFYEKVKWHLLQKHFTVILKQIYTFFDLARLFVRSKGLLYFVLFLDLRASKRPFEKHIIRQVLDEFLTYFVFYGRSWLFSSLLSLFAVSREHIAISS